MLGSIQLVGALVLRAQDTRPQASISSMVLTRYYARIRFGIYEMELSRARDARYISITLHADKATGLLAQVQTRLVQLVPRLSFQLVAVTHPSASCSTAAIY